MKSIRPSLKPLWWIYIGVSVVLFYLGMAVDAAELSLFVMASTLVAALCIIATFGYVRQARYVSALLWSVALVLSIVMTIGPVLWALAQGALPLSDFLSLPFAGALLFVFPGWWACYCYAFRSPHIWGIARPGQG